MFHKKKYILIILVNFNIVVKYKITYVWLKISRSTICWFIFVLDWVKD